MVSSDHEAARTVLHNLGFKPDAWNHVVMVAAALDRGIEVFQKSGKRSIYLRLGTQEHRWFAGNSGLNSALARRCITQKDVCARLLRNAGALAPENYVFDVHEPRRAWAWAEPLAPVVVKPYDGRQGRDVHMGVESQEELTRVFGVLAHRHRSLLVEKQVTGQDHRVLVVDGSVIAITHRRPANVQGDGFSSIAELVARKNLDRGVAHKALVIDDISERFLAGQELSVDSVLPAGQQVAIRGSANVATGGDAVDVTDEVRGEVADLMARSMQAIPGLRCAGFDVTIPHVVGDDPTHILEINASPQIQGHHFPWEGTPRDAAGAVLDAMFPGSRR